MKKALKLRDWIWKALCAIVLEEAYSNLYLKEHLDELDPVDRSLATRIVYGTLQNYSYCEAVWKQYAQKRVKPKIRVLLTFTVYQLLFTDVPAYAAIDQAVELAKLKDRSIASFVNAILHKIDREKIKLPENILERLAFENSLPLWLLQKWEKAYGLEKAELYANSSRAIHPVFARSNPVKSGKAGLTVYPGSPARDPEYAQGLFSIQDPGSYEIAKFVQAEPGMNVLDVCAAPGTKTFAVAEIMENQGHIDALDLYESRVKLIEKDRDRLGLDIVSAIAQDSTDLSGFGQYDRILCDVPCSGYGVLARKPDMKIHLQENKEELLQIQRDLLEAAKEHLKKDGKLIYSTCTLDPAENEKQVEWFIDKNPGFEIEEMKTVDLNEEHDGFFMARLKRV